MILTHWPVGIFDEKAWADRYYTDLLFSSPVPDTYLPVLVIMTGLPGTGKTHLSSSLCSRAPFTLIGSDTLRAALLCSPIYSSDENGLVYRLADDVIWRLLHERRDVIYDAVNLSEGRRQALRTLALDAGACPLTVRTSAPENVIRRRLAQRLESAPQPGASQADWPVYRKLTSRAERVAHQHIAIDTTQDITPALMTILDAIEALTGRRLNAR